MFAAMMGRKNQLSSMQCVFFLFFFGQVVPSDWEETAPSEPNEMVTQLNIGRSQC